MHMLFRIALLAAMTLALVAADTPVRRTAASSSRSSKVRARKVPKPHIKGRKHSKQSTKYKPIRPHRAAKARNRRAA